MYLQSIKSVKHNAANSVNRSILKKSRHLGFGVFIVHSSMCEPHPVVQYYRPPPPIQMYSIEDTEDHRGPIYDTINDGDSGHSSYSRSNGSSDNGGVPPAVVGAYPRSTFGTPGVGGGGAIHNGGFAGDYDVPEGGDELRHHSALAARNSAAIGTVTINGIAV